jgi:hypothetical protein
MPSTGQHMDERRAAATRRASEIASRWRVIAVLGRSGTMPARRRMTVQKIKFQSSWALPTRAARAAVDHLPSRKRCALKVDRIIDPVPVL